MPTVRCTNYPGFIAIQAVDSSSQTDSPTLRQHGVGKGGFLAVGS
jgi:hypothetical protein